MHRLFVKGFYHNIDFKICTDIVHFVKNASFFTFSAKPLDNFEKPAIIMHIKIK